MRLAAAAAGIPLLRNNVGACRDKTGRLIRFGLGNDSSQLNRVFKSSDLIGIRPVMITEDMVGQVIGQFVAIECKREDFKARESDDRFTAQRNFGEWVIRHGGWFEFCQNAAELSLVP